MIMGILAAIVVPNVATFFGTGTLNAARNEAENVRTAAFGYYGEHNVWPSDSSELGAFVSASPKARYLFDTTTGHVTGVSDVEWSGLAWSTEQSTWTRS